jgi:hypothetical protein
MVDLTKNYVDLSEEIIYCIYTLCPLNIAMQNGPFIYDLCTY